MKNLVKLGLIRSILVRGCCMVARFLSIKKFQDVLSGDMAV